jgi:hypothetical protein
MKINLVCNKKASNRVVYDTMLAKIYKYNEKYSQNVHISGTKSTFSMTMYDSMVVIDGIIENGHVVINEITIIDELISEKTVKRELMKIFSIQSLIDDEEV